MNSKEALDEMFDLLNYEQTGICGDKNLYRIIAQDLDRLEMLEKQNKVLNESVGCVNKVLEDLGKINEENTKLKKAIKILKGRICVHNQYICYDAYADIRLKDNEIELLKEVLKNDK
jgi:hypothetical protein